MHERRDERDLPSRPNGVARTALSMRPGGWSTEPLRDSRPRSAGSADERPRPRFPSDERLLLVAHPGTVGVCDVEDRQVPARERRRPEPRDTGAEALGSVGADVHGQARAACPSNDDLTAVGDVETEAACTAHAERQREREVVGARCRQPPATPARGVEERRQEAVRSRVVGPSLAARRRSPQTSRPERAPAATRCVYAPLLAVAATASVRPGPAACEVAAGDDATAAIAVNSAVS